MPAKGTSELARDTLRMLAARRLLPNPENFAAVYHELAGAAATGVAPAAAAPVAATPPAPGAAPARAGPDSGAAGSGPSPAGLSAAGVPAGASPATVSSAAVPQQRLVAELCEQVARLVEFALPALGDDDPRIGTDAQALAAACRDPAVSASLSALRSRLANFNHRLSFVAEDQAGIRASLLGMLQLVFANISELSLEDRWLHGQVEMLTAAAAPPVSQRRLDDVQRRLKDVIRKQGELKRSVLAAQEDTRRLLATFMERLSELAALSGTQGTRIGQVARRMEAAADLAEMRSLLGEAIGATRQLADQAVQARDDLDELRRQAAASQSEVQRLRLELESASVASRHDALTGLPNRTGLDEAMARELERVRRLDSRLAVALLDIDDFKRINDEHGHPAGDSALSHLASVARGALRRQDTLSRVGGEEFVILMPDTGLEEGAELLRHVQRELTRHYFMAGGSRLLITFSAGVTLVGEAEDPREALARSDRCMYVAKRSGKNRVVTG